MSIFHDHDVACPACGRIESRSLALSLHGSRVPAIVQQILDGTFQRFTCAACAHEFVIETPMLFLQVPERSWAHVMPVAWQGAWRALEVDAQRRFDETVAKNAPESIRAIARSFTQRLIFGLQSFREKLLLRRAGIDDVDVETYKLALIGAREDALVPSYRVDAIDDDLVFVGAPEGALRLPRRKLVEVTRAPAYAALRSRLIEGPFVAAERIYVEGHAPSPLASGSTTLAP